MDLMPSAGDSVTMELNRRTPAGVGVRDLLAGVGRPLATHSHIRIGCRNLILFMQTVKTNVTMYCLYIVILVIINNK